MKQLNDTYLADWLAGKISDEELKALVGEEHFITYKNIISEVDGWKAPERIKNHKAEILSKISSATEEKFSIKRWLTIAATLLILVGAFNIISPKTYKNDVGEPQQITLNDGTKITMEANSQVKVSKLLWQFSRTISAQGNLYFEVAKGATFTISSPNGEVQILGTKFRIIDRLDYYNVTCYEGKVSVRLNDISEVKLTPGNSIDNIEKKICNINMDTDQNLLREFLFYQRTPVKVVLEDLKAIYNIKVTYDKLEKELYFSGRLPRNDQQTALTTLLAPFHLELKSVGNDQFEILP